MTAVAMTVEQYQNLIGTTLVPATEEQLIELKKEFDIIRDNVTDMYVGDDRITALTNGGNVEICILAFSVDDSFVYVRVTTLEKGDRKFWVNPELLDGIHSTDKSGKFAPYRKEFISSCMSSIADGKIVLLMTEERIKSLGGDMELLTQGFLDKAEEIKNSSED